MGSFFRIPLRLRNGELLQLSKRRRVGVIGAAGIAVVHDFRAALHGDADHLLQISGGKQLAHVALRNFRAKRSASNRRYFVLDPVDAIEHSAKRGENQNQDDSADDQQSFAAAGRFWRLRGRWLRRRLGRLLCDAVGCEIGG